MPAFFISEIVGFHWDKASVLAQNGLSFDLATTIGELLRTITAGLAESERDLISDRVNSGDSGGWG